MMKATTSIIMAITAAMAIGVKLPPQAPVRALSQRSSTPRGRPATMPAKISSDMPLPIPRSVICSPSHMMNTEPAVRVSMAINTNPTPGLTTSCVPTLLRSKLTAMPSDCRAESTAVR